MTAPSPRTSIVSPSITRVTTTTRGTGAGRRAGSDGCSVGGAVGCSLFGDCGVGGGGWAGGGSVGVGGAGSFSVTRVSAVLSADGDSSEAGSLFSARSAPSPPSPRRAARRTTTAAIQGCFGRRGLTQLAVGADWEPVDVPLRGPKPADITRHYEAARAWTASWNPDSRKHLRVEHKRLGGRLAGVNNVPDRVWIDSREDLWSLLGVTNTVSRFTSLLTTAHDTMPPLAAWMTAHPMKVVKLQADWPRIAATLRWIADYQGGPAIYVRQIDVPGVDTKFIEHHRPILTTLLEYCLPPDRIDTEAPRTDFAARFGFLQKPSYVRFRLLDGATLGGFRELTVRTHEFRSPPPGITTVYVVENETTYLAFPDRPHSIVIHGGGYAVTLLSTLAWLRDVRLIYWGDLDTHGFAILDRLRQEFPHTESILMTRDILVSHRDQWVKEASPTHERLDNLTPEEAALHESLKEGSLGDNIRLEQERIRFRRVEEALT
ncbi:Wadjet anti-phage system protein JetD domain-containing protein [Streptomyces sp. NPDC085466]|uniref:Wadjet anti-phage system protein JetD domain-containing protein n=1 Tax=Streptomyces sp. NPDC085466 TaxID=3365725 RepID=UPI0037D3703F